MPDLNTIWFVIVGALFFGYAVLDGFDLGVGALHLWTRTDEDRRTMLNAIGPVWDGNEVWLVTAGGALFAAFPNVYATAFSGFYIPFMLLLFALIFRAVAIEFRSKQESKKWRTTWDISFSVASIVAALLIGIALGNIAWGIPLGTDGEFSGTLAGLIAPYPLLVGLTTLALFVMHGAIYVVLKTEGELHQRARQWVRNGIIFFIICYAITTLFTLLYVPHMTAAIRMHPGLFVIPIVNVLAIANIPRCIHGGKDLQAFLSSGLAMLALLGLFGIGMFPNMIYSNPNPDLSLTLYNSASSPKTLRIMLVIAGLGIPAVLAYTISIYWIFRGKVKIESHSY